MQIRRVRRQSVHDDWPNCECCNEDMSAGFEFWADIGHFAVCDGCLAKAKSSKLASCVDGKQIDSVQRSNNASDS